jgi:hypothetical protein
MRFATSTVAILGLLCLGTTFAAAQERTANVPATPVVTTVADEVLVTPVRRYVYQPVPGWHNYYSPQPYYTYRPRYYWYGPPRYYNYYADPDWRYYYPSGFDFEFHGPRRSFSFGF